ncbi:MAG: SLC13 family permease [Geminicoccaceae bacterium]
MSVEQGLVFAILGIALVFFVWGRWRYDVVAMTALLAGVATGVVPADGALAGFSDPAVITVAAVLVISRALRDSGLIERGLAPLAGHLQGVNGQVVVFAGLVAACSTVMNNVGALAVFLPAALQTARRTGSPPSALLMPMSFASLLGGLVTLIGTPPNLLISAVRRESQGEGFHMFDFAPVGLTLTVAGLAFLLVGWRLLPRNRSSSGDPETAFEIQDYVIEVRLGETSSMDGKTVAQLEEAAEGNLRVLAVMRGRTAEVPSRYWVLRAGDDLQIEAEPKLVESFLDSVGIAPTAHDPSEGDRDATEFAIFEVMVGSDSPLVGRSVAMLGLRENHALNLLAVRRGQDRPRTRLAGLTLRPGDILMLQGRRDGSQDALGSLGLLPLAGRGIRLGQRRFVWLPLLALAAAVVASTIELTTPAVAFLAAATLLVIFRAIPADDTYAAISWPVIVLLAALIPISDALRATGGTDLIAGWLGSVSGSLTPVTALGLILLATMIVTPFLNNAATVLVMAPIGAAYARQLGLAVDPFLMAVAVGASSDFLTPIGHQSNTLVMGPGGYRFVDYARLGAPLSLLVLVLGTASIAFFWPLHP